MLSGFVHSQMLCALVELGVLEALGDGAQPLGRLAKRIDIPEERLRVLVTGGVALGLLRLRKDTVRLALRGESLLAVPGLTEMVRHNRILFRDLADPEAFFRGGQETELARFWPYVFGAGAAEDPETAARYSRLMADSQVLVAEETLNAVSLAKSKRLMDVGGGSGMFLSAALERWPHLNGVLFDLPSVVPSGRQRFAALGLAERTEVIGGSFRDDPLPDGADTISLVRVLYDHADNTVTALLKQVHAVLPSGGRLIVSEPMLGHKNTYTYFATYTLAMGTGKTRSPDEIAALLVGAGFAGVQPVRTNRPFLTSVVTALRP